jgi:flavin-dependent thymidylate synthase
MSIIILRDKFDVDLVEASGDDAMICRAARVSTIGADSLDTEESEGLLNFLMSNRHGSPFEHGMMTMRITAPIFVWREFMRHRIGFSYNEESGRYKKLEPVFYVPPEQRPLVQIGKPGHYEFVAGSSEDHRIAHAKLITAYDKAWHNYEDMLAADIAKEVARMCLPVSIYSTAYVTCNPRSMMSFLSLRTKDDASMFPSYPMWEINQVANEMEEIFNDLFPITAKLFHENGRVSP